MRPLHHPPTYKWLKALCLLFILLAAVLMVMFGSEKFHSIGIGLLIMWLIYVVPILNLTWLNWRDELATPLSDNTDSNTRKHRWLHSPAMGVILRIASI